MMDISNRELIRLACQSPDSDGDELSIETADRADHINIVIDTPDSPDWIYIQLNRGQVAQLVETLGAWMMGLEP